MPWCFTAGIFDVLAAYLNITSQTINAKAVLLFQHRSKQCPKPLKQKTPKASVTFLSINFFAVKPTQLSVSNTEKSVREAMYFTYYHNAFVVQERLQQCARQLVQIIYTNYKGSLFLH